MANKVDIAAASTQRLVSILIPCCGMLEYTKLCVPSVLRYTRPPFELIFLDIGSLDGTEHYLDGIRAACTSRVEMFRIPNDLHIPELCREAIAEARGEYVVLLNNDTIVSEGWLNQLITLANMAPSIGMTGPMSNYAAPPQLVETVPYRIKPRYGGSSPRYKVSEGLVEVAAVHAFAKQFRAEGKAKWLETQRLGGFCVLVKREVLDKIGLAGLAPWTDLGLFDTDILSTKARQMGYTLACCRDVFVHHFGTRTFSSGASTRDEGPGTRDQGAAARATT